MCVCVCILFKKKCLSGAKLQQSCYQGNGKLSARPGWLQGYRKQSRLTAVDRLKEGGNQMRRTHHIHQAHLKERSGVRWLPSPAPPVSLTQDNCPYFCFSSWWFFSADLHSVVPSLHQAACNISRDEICDCQFVSCEVWKCFIWKWWLNPDETERCTRTVTDRLAGQRNAS